MYERILLPVDDRDMTEVFEHAADIASQRGARVHVLSVVDERAFLTLEDDVQDEAIAQLRAAGDEAMEDAKSFLEAAGVTVETATRDGDPAEEIIDYATDNDIGLVVMGTRRGDYSQSMLGSVSQQVIEKSAFPVLTVNVGENGP